MTDETVHPDVASAEEAVEKEKKKNHLPPAYLDFRLAVLKRARTRSG